MRLRLPLPARGLRRVVPLVLAGVLTDSGASHPLPAEGIPTYRYELARTGDLVFRRGRSLRSRAVLLADAGSAYSHVGVVVRRADGPWVVNAEPPTAGRPGGVVLEPLQTFLAPEEAAGGALYRPRLLTPDRTRALVETLQREVARRTPFDDDFSLATPERLYCTELVWRAYAAAGIPLLSRVPPPRVTPLGVRTYIYPTDLLGSRELEAVPGFAWASQGTAP